MRWCARALLYAVFLIVAGWCFTACQSLPACDTNWIGPAGGNFHDASSWDTGSVPGAASTACAPSGSSIVVDDAEAANSLQVQGSITIMPTGSLDLGVGGSAIFVLDQRGTLTGPGAVAIGTLSWTGGSMRGTGTTLLLNLAPSTITGPVTIEDTRGLGLLAKSTTSWSGSIQVCNSARLVVAGTLTSSAPGASVTQAGCAAASGNSFMVYDGGVFVAAESTTLALPVVNDGTTRVTGTATLDLPASTFTQTHGTIDVASSAASVRVGGGSGFLQPAGGTLQGVGTVQANVRGVLTVSPGGAGGAGVLQITGSYQPARGSILNVDLGGTTPGVDQDQLTVHGGALGFGRLAVHDLNGFTPTAGQTFPVINNVNIQSWSTLVGAFGSVDQPAPTGPPVYASYTATGVALGVGSCDRSSFHPSASLASRTVSAQTLIGCDLSGSSGAFASFTGSNLRGANLSGTSLMSPTFSNVDLTSANLQGAILEVSHLSLVTWSHTICPDGTNSDDHGSSCASNLLSSTVTVTSTADAATSAACPSFGTCLRAAIQQANASTGVTKIQLAAGQTYGLTLGGAGDDVGTTGDLDVWGAVLITVPSGYATIDAHSLDRVLDIHPGGSVLLEGVSLQGGDGGGGVRNAGAVYSLGATLSSTQGIGADNTGGFEWDGPISAGSGTALVNEAGAGGALQYATVTGGIVNHGSLLLAQNTKVQGATIGLDNDGTVSFGTVSFSANTIGIRSASPLALGPSVTVTGGSTGVDSSGTLDLNNAKISGATRGVVSHGTLTMTGTALTGFPDTALVATGTSTITSSSFLGNGRGIDASGSLTLTRSTIGTSAAAPAGGSPAAGLVVSGAGTTVTVDQSTVADNGGAGIAISSGALSLSFSTVADNAGGNLVATGGTATATSSVLASNAGVSAAPSCAGTIVSGGFNVSSDSSCGLTGTGDVQNVAPLLGVLADNGGATKTVLPLMGSPVIDRGGDACAATDQRGSPRPMDGDGDGVVHCDAGSVETPTYRALTIVVNATADLPDANPGDGVCQTATAGQCTLRAAAQESSASFGPDTITLMASTRFTLARGAGQLSFAAPLVLNGNGSTIDASGDSTGNGNYGGMTITSSGPVSISSLSIVNVWSAAAITNNAAQLVASDVTLSGGNQVIDNRGSLTLVRANLAATYGGLYDGDAVRNAGTASISGSTFHDLHGTAVETTAGAATTIVGSTFVSAANGVVNAGTTQLTDVTIARVTTAISTTTGAVTATNSILAATGAACSGPVVSGGWNLASDSSCALSGPNDIQGADPHVGPLVMNGGSVPTVLPMSPSQAIDTGEPGCSGPDQAGVARPVDGNGDGTAGCDRGATEARAYRSLALTVTTNADGNDAAPGDGVCATSTGACTLRAAIEESNASNGPDTIDLQTNASYTVPTICNIPQTGCSSDYTNDPYLASDLTLHGHGASVTFSPAFWGSPALVWDHLTVNGGYLPDMDRASLTWTSVTLAAILNSHGTVRWDGGGTPWFNNGCCLTFTGDVQLTNLALVASVSSSGTLVATNDTFAGLSNSGTATVTASSVNASPNWGSTRNTGTLSIDHSTISAPPFIFDAGQAQITSSTMIGSVLVASGNVAFTNVTFVHDDPGSKAIVKNGGTMTVTSSILDSSGGAATCSAPIASGGSNITRDATCGLNGPSDRMNTDPKLGPANILGGAQTTYLPLAGSPAIDGGQPGCASTDQLGRPRPTDGDGDGTAVCDIGALETGAYAVRTFTVNSTADTADVAPGDGVCQTAVAAQCTLRGALMEANADSGPTTVKLAAFAGYWQTSGAGPLVIAAPVSIRGLTSSTINAKDFGDAIQVVGGMNVSVDTVIFKGIKNGAAAIRNPSGTLTLTNVSFQDTLNETSDGAGVVNGGTVSMTGGSTSHLGYGIVNTGTATITNVSIQSSVGAGLRNSGSMTVARTLVSLKDGIATEGILSTAGSLTITDTTVTGVATGIHVTGGGATIADSTIVANTSTAIAASSSTATVTNSILGAANGVGTLACSGGSAIVSGGWNLISDSTCGFVLATDLQGVDPHLGALASNGGPTQTMMPQAGSAAIDSGNPACAPLDQRGRTRPFDGDGDGIANCDRGAVEAGA